MHLKPSKNIVPSTAIALCMLLLPGTSAFSQNTPEMVTDRPDQSESSNIVLPGYVQFESGLLLTKANDDNVTEIFGTLARIGILEKLELRLGIDGLIFDGASDTKEFGDSEIGVKYFLWEENGFIPESALMGGIGIPTSKVNKDIGYSIRYAGSYTLSSRFSAGFNLAGGWEKGIDDKGDEAMNMSLMYTAVIGYGISDQLSCFIEYFGESPVDVGEKPANLIDGGFTYLVNETFQLDAYGGVGVTDAAADWMLGAGFSYLFGY